LEGRWPPSDREPPPASQSVAEEALVAKFVSAYEAADLDGVVALLTEDVFMSMPPIPFEYEGRGIVARFMAGLFGSRKFDLVRTRANGQPAFGAYLRTSTGPRPGTGLVALTLAGDRISALRRFENHALPWFGLPSSLR
jgi:RNA polymerase sigma-70 factor (ECF subfamily)